MGTMAKTKLCPQMCGETRICAHHDVWCVQKCSAPCKSDTVPCNTILVAPFCRVPPLIRSRLAEQLKGFCHGAGRSGVTRGRSGWHVNVKLDVAALTPFCCWGDAKQSTREKFKVQVGTRMAWSERDPLKDGHFQITQYWCSNLEGPFSKPESYLYHLKNDKWFGTSVRWYCVNLKIKTNNYNFNGIMRETKSIQTNILGKLFKICTWIK